MVVQIPKTSAEGRYTHRYTFCSVVDRNPRFYVELVLWAICAGRYLPTDDFRFIVYFVGTPPPDLDDWLEARGIETRSIEPVVEGSPHCNKIAPFFDDHNTNYVMVSDLDLYFVGDPSRFINTPRFRAPPNNAGNPPPQIFKEILSATGLDRPYRPGMTALKGEGGIRETHINNISAGLVVAPSHRSMKLGRCWRKWSNWLVANRPLLGRWGVHIDQIGFALAMEELGEDVEFLPPHLNAIPHILNESQQLMHCIYRLAIYRPSPITWGSIED